uniref:Variable lymphocyte receptor B cassette n=1 Tax=Petromyzon marinus TaxID=7757 RepID=S4R752_PETMA
EVDCQSKGLQAIPPGIPVDTAMLRLDFNNFKSLDATAFKGLGSVTYLGLESAGIESLSVGLFDHFPNLESLWLKSNMLQSPPRRFRGLTKQFGHTQTLNLLQTLPPGVFDQLRELKDLYLGSNQLKSL